MERIKIKRNEADYISDALRLLGHKGMPIYYELFRADMIGDPTVGLQPHPDVLFGRVTLPNDVQYHCPIWGDSGFR